MIEYGVFRKNQSGVFGPPLGNRVFISSQLAEIEITHYADGPEWLEVRSRAVTQWLREGES